MKEKIKLYVLLLIKLSNLSVLLYLEIFLKEEQKKCLFYLKKNISKSICRAILRTKERSSNWLARIM